MKRLSVAEAKKRYIRYTDNATIHSNRFPAWEELSPEARKKWRDPDYQP